MIAAAPVRKREPPASRERSTTQTALTRLAHRWALGSAPLPQVETVATECPVALVYNGVSHAVMMASPADLEDMGRGFSIAEGIVAASGEIASLEVLDMVLGFEIRMEIPAGRAAALDERRRSMAGGSACGLCGVISLDQAVRPLPRAKLGFRLDADALRAGFRSLPDRQNLFRHTGAVHAAALASPAGEIVLVREDVGRHNALDKLVGGATTAGLDPAAGLLLLTSRCSSEMIQKAATAGFCVVATISAPTSLAIALAEEADLTLIAFARNDQFTVYTGPDRIAP